MWATFLVNVTCRPEAAEDWAAASAGTANEAATASAVERCLDTLRTMFIVDFTGLTEDREMSFGTDFGELRTHSGELSTIPVSR